MTCASSGSRSLEIQNAAILAQGKMWLGRKPMQQGGNMN